MKCPHCTKQLFRKSADGSRLKTSTRMLVLHKAGGVEFNCTHCRKGVVMKVRALPETIQKAEPAFLVPRNVSRKV